MAAPSCLEPFPASQGRSKNTGNKQIDLFEEVSTPILQKPKTTSQSSDSSTGARSSESVIEHKIGVLLKSSASLYSTGVASYISKFRLLQIVESQISLLSLSTDGSLGVEEYLESFRKQIEAIKRCLTRLRADCIKEGHSLHLIEEVLSSCKIHDPDTGFRLPTHNTLIRHTDLFALRKRRLKGNFTFSDEPYTKRHRINNWLFQNLQSSPENAALHRSMMVQNDMDEKNWARTVVKYWSIDEAATGEEYDVGKGSTNAVADSNAKSLDGDGEVREDLEGGRSSKNPWAPKRISVSRGLPTTFVLRIEFPVRTFSLGNMETSHMALSNLAKTYNIYRHQLSNIN